MRTTRRRPLLAVLTALALTVPLTATVAPAAPASAAETPTVRINEVESSGGVPGDWIEIVNYGSSEVDVSGWVLKDDNDARTLAIASGTALAAGAFLAVEVDVTGGFGLGGADSARLFLADGVSLVDSYTWTAHATSTYGRYPDGTGEFVTTAAATKGTANEPVVEAVPVVVEAPEVRVNEVESSGGTPGDWAELFNAGTTTVDISGWIVKDSDDTHISVIPAATTLAAGDYYVVEEAALGYGLGSADSVRVYTADGVTLVDSRSWTAHASTSYGICGTGFVTTTATTKGALNDCSSPVRINEVESNDGTPGDWIELINTGAAAIDISGYVLKDSDDSHTFVVPAATTIAAGGYYVADVDADATTGYGLGKADSARLFAADGTTVIDSYTWTAHATTSYGRCVDGTGDFATTAATTKGAVNACVGDLVTQPWPGAAAIATADVQNVLGGNMSGLAYEASDSGDVLWAAKNGTGTLYRLVSDGTNWVSDEANDWGAGKVLHYADGTGDVDAEGVTLTDDGVDGGVFISSERNNDASGVSRLSVLRYDATAAGSTLNATMEWNLNSDLPVVGANAGLEAIAWISDSVLVEGGLLDESTNAAYDPALYADHGEGLFFVGVEAGGTIYAYALDQVNGGYHRVATIASGFTGVMDLEFEAETGSLWAVCDDTCNGRSAVLDIAQGGTADGTFVVSTVVERPASMPNINNEGFAMAPQSECVAGSKAVFWADDSNTDGYAIRTGSIDCTVLAEPTPTPTPTPTDPTPTPTPEPTVTPTPTSTPEPTTTPEPTVTSEPTPAVTPTATPTVDPTDSPTVTPTATPTDSGNLGATTPIGDASFTEAARGSVTAPIDAHPGDSVTITVGAAHAGETVNVWLHSTPTLLGTVTVTASGTVTVAIASDAPVGAHRIAVLAQDGTLIGWDNITLTALASGVLASTGADLQLPLRVALLLLIAGAGLFVLRRRQSAAL